MAEAQLNIRSTRARDIARKLAKRHRSTVSKIVEAALEDVDRREAQASNSKKVDAKDFWQELHKSLYPTGEEADIDLEAIIAEGRLPHKPIEL